MPTAARDPACTNSVLGTDRTDCCSSPTTAAPSLTRASPDSGACDSTSQSLLPTPHVEIIKPPLPETPRRLSRCLRPQTHLLGALPSVTSPQGSRHALLQNLHHRRRGPHLRFRNQQMNVIRHHHIPNQPELISLAHLIQNSQKHIPAMRSPQQRPPPVTTTCNKVQLPVPVPALQPVTHRMRAAAHPCLPTPGSRACGTRNCKSNGKPETE